MRLKFGKSKSSRQAEVNALDTPPPAATKEVTEDSIEVSTVIATKEVAEDSIEASTAVSALTNSPSKTVASSSSWSSSLKSPLRRKKKKTTRKTKKNKNKHKNKNPVDESSERIVIGDEYAIVSVQPKGFSRNADTGAGAGAGAGNSIPWEPATYPEQGQEQSQVEHPIELKNQKVSMVRMLSMRNRTRKKGGGESVQVEEPILSNEGYELPRSTSMQPEKLKKRNFSFRRVVSTRK